MTASTIQGDEVRQRILRVLVHIQQHLDESLSDASLAKIAGWSVPHFRATFRGLMGESVHQHVRRLRLERAAMYLLCFPRPVAEIATAHGFSSREAFTRAFRQAFGTSPQDYRERSKDTWFLRTPNEIHYSSEKLSPELLRPRREWNGPEIVPRFVTRSPTRVAFMRHTGSFEKADTIWLPFLFSCWRRGWLSRETLFFGISHDEEFVTEQDQLRYDAAIELPDPTFQGYGSLGVQEITGGEYVVLRYSGPVEGYLSFSDHVCGEWYLQSGLTLRDATFFEQYVVPPDVARNPFKLWNWSRKDVIADLHIPIETGK